MLKATTLKIFKDLGIDTKKLQEAMIADAEVDFAMPEINAYTTDQLEERDRQVVAAAKPAIHTESKNQGIEIANKAIAKKFGLTDVDTKDTQSVIGALDANVLKGDGALKEQVKLLQADKDKLTGDIESERTKAAEATFDAELISAFPQGRKADLSDRDYLTITKANLQFEVLDGVRVAKKDGAVIRDPKTQAAIPFKDAVKTLFTEKKLIVEEGGSGGGRGGGDNSGAGGAGGIKSYSKAIEQFKKEFPDGNELSPEAMSYVDSIAKETTDFVYD
jgi:hypothetical protein